MVAPFGQTISNSLIKLSSLPLSPRLISIQQTLSTVRNVYKSAGSHLQPP